MENKSSAGNELFQFFLGVILLGIGLFVFSKHVVVSSTWYTWGYMGMGVSSGMTVVPLIIGIIWMFFNKKSVAAKIVTILGVLFILATVIMSINMRFVPTSLYDYILMIGMVAAGTGLVLKTLFKPQNTKED